MPRKKTKRACKRGGGPRGRLGGSERRVGNAYPVAFRQRVVEEAVRQDASWCELSRLFGSVDTHVYAVRGGALLWKTAVEWRMSKSGSGFG